MTRRGLAFVLVTGMAVLVVTAALLGYFVGAVTSGVSRHTVTVDSEARVITVHEDGRMYTIPLDVAWTDARGDFHEGGRPDCLPATGSIASITLGSVEVSENGTAWTQVVWVSCQP